METWGDLHQCFSQMLFELDTQHLDVVLTPAPDPQYEGHCIRWARGQNPKWYQDLCQAYPDARNLSRRKFKTRVKRKHIRRLLLSLAQGKPIESYFKEDLIKISQQMCSHDEVPF